MDLMALASEPDFSFFGIVRHDNYAPPRELLGGAEQTDSVDAVSIITVGLSKLRCSNWIGKFCSRRFAK
jgi:hypothetical protein